MEDLHLKALISSYWYHRTLQAKATNAVDYANFTSVLNRIVQRIAEIEG